ncbi:MAG: NAD(P)/FAD-dependent oxidoreductase [Chloroflexi bacterium]|nr:NAD(P)/FAD-dependent oxidoreductase [Chloroflexota bacterium]
MSEKNKKYDVIIVGGGHNGLVAAGYLAKAGQSVLVLEKRDMLGGATITEEFVPGFKFSSLANDAGSLSPEVATDLKLHNHGFNIIPTNPLINSLLPDGNHLRIWQDTEKTVEEIAKFSKADAEAYPKFVERMQKVSGIVAKMNEIVPPDLPDLAFFDIKELSALLSPSLNLGWRHIAQVIRLLPMSVSDLLNEWFESDTVKGAIAASAILNTTFGPQEINSTAYTFLQNWSVSNTGLFRSSGQVKGGVGALSEALAKSAQSFGATIMTGAAVAKINISADSVRGVILASGEEILAKAVISATDMRTTFLKLVDPYYLEAKFIKHVKNIKYQGTMARVHLALERLPTFSGMDGDVSEYLSGHIQVSPSVEYIQRASDRIKYGEYSEKPYLDMQIPTLADPSLAPDGKHILSVTVKYMPYKLRDGNWDDLREEIGKLVIDTLSEYAPDLRECVQEQKIITPLEMESVYALPEGSPVHGDMALNQFLWMRPMPGHAQYRGPFEGLYMCSVATHPGCGVTGISGRNAARQLLGDQ